jgi:hypothetical protein
MSGQTKHMRLALGQYLGKEQGTGNCRFTMRLGSQVIKFAVTQAALEVLATRHKLSGYSDQHADWNELFELLRDQIELKAEERYFSQNEEKRSREILLTSGDV